MNSPIDREIYLFISATIWKHVSISFMDKFEKINGFHSIIN